MFNYYFGLAIRSLKRNIVLTVLMIAAVGVGIGASMTTLTVFRAMDGDPIPQKSRQLFAVQIDNWGPNSKTIVSGDAEHFQSQISYMDAIALMNAQAAQKQSAMYVTGAALTPPNPDVLPFQVQIRAAYSDFFSMFDTPFLMGGPWSADDDKNHAEVAVISRELNEKVFGGTNSIGKTINLDGHEYRVVGILGRWDPTPKFYDLNNNAYGKSAEVYLPFTRAIDREMASWGNNNCNATINEPGWAGRLRSECIWLQFWAELPTPADVEHYRFFLNNYASDQQRLGRFTWPAHTRIRDVREWLVYQHAVSDEVRILVLVSFSFLLVCLLNAMGLMLAKIMGRAGDIGVRRALGASRRAIFGQCLIEAGVVGLAGGLLGLALTALGLMGLRSLLSEEITRLAHFSPSDIAIAIFLAVVATTLAGLYPTWRAAQVQPAWQLKAQ
ncbi:MAG: putative transport system permease protein [Gammaproteobacteria bacterium]|jgi:putative ABC transport system permease protein|nr:putative transport system permease protein [Gammaproteobacteria bacterium]